MSARTNSFLSDAQREAVMALRHAMHRESGLSDTFGTTRGAKANSSASGSTGSSLSSMPAAMSIPKAGPLARSDQSRCAATSMRCRPRRLA